jgi:hypothetical protein
LYFSNSSTILGTSFSTLAFSICPNSLSNALILLDWLILVYRIVITFF